MTLGEYIKQYRADHDMSIRSFASMVGMSVQQICNIENGVGSDGKPIQSSTMKTYKKIADALGMTETEFLFQLNDDVRTNPTGEKIPITKSDGQYMVIDLSTISEAQKASIQEILNATPQILSVASPELESLLSSPQVQDDSTQTQ